MMFCLGSLILLSILCNSAAFRRVANELDEVSLSVNELVVSKHSRNNANASTTLAIGEDDALAWAKAMASLTCVLTRAAQIHATYRDEAMQIVVRMFTIEQSYALKTFADKIKKIQADLVRTWTNQSMDTIFDSEKFMDDRFKLMMLGRNDREYMEAGTTIQGFNFTKIYGKGLDLKSSLHVGFDYNHERDKCLNEMDTTKVQSYVEANARELKLGACTGDCKKIGSHTCRADDSKHDLCPEGTACQCLQEFNKFAPVIFVVSFASIFGATAALAHYVHHPSIAAAMPITPMAAAVTSFFASKYVGCVCLPQQCEILTTELYGKVCSIKYVGARNDISIGDGMALPYPGSKCAVNNKGICLLQGCEGDDVYPSTSINTLGKLGRLGTNTYNCWRPFWQGFVYTPRSEREKVYRDEIPGLRTNQVEHKPAKPELSTNQFIKMMQNQGDLGFDPESGI